MIIKLYTFLVAIVSVTLVTIATAPSLTCALEQKDCPVCFSVLKKLQDSKSKDLEEEFLDLCKHPTKTERSFCYYMGGDKVSATRTYKDMVDKLQSGMPIDKVCDYINKKDPQICMLREKQTVKLRDLDFKSMKVKDLKKILADKGDPCKGCMEKSEYISRLNKIRDAEVESEAEL